MSGSHSTEQIAACSRGLLARTLGAPAELIVSICNDVGDTRGAWSSASGAPRGGGGGTIALGPGSVYVALILESASAVVPDGDPDRLVNRHVRPLLAALSKLGVLSMYGGRDFIASKKSPIGWVGFQHSAETGRAAFEAILGVEWPIATAARKSFLDRAPKSLQAVGCSRDPGTIAERIEEAYRAAYPAMVEVEGEVEVGVGVEVEVKVEVEVEVKVEVEVEVGVVGARRWAAGSGHVYDVYGDFYASREVVGRIASGLAAGSSVEACLDAALSGAVLFGVPASELARVIGDVIKR